MADAPGTPDNFKLATNDDFKAKASAVFAFDEVKLTTPTPTEPPPAPETPAEAARPVQTEDFKGRESLYRVPEHEWDRKPRRERAPPPARDPHQFRKPYQRPARRAPRRPDYQQNPQKYTKYSLKDVDLTSNRGNSQAAWAFMREIRDRQTDEENADDAEAEARKVRGQIQFQKRSKVKSASASGSAVSRPSMRLSHLMEDEEEEDDG